MDPINSYLNVTVVFRHIVNCCNRNHKLETSTAPTKMKSWEPTYSLASGPH